MSGIGGIMDIENYGVDTEKLRDMSLSLSLRGRKRSTAFCEGRVGMFFNSSSSDAFCDGEDRQPNISSRRGQIYAMCIDGEGFDSSAVLEKYMLYGVEAVGLLDGAFALSLYDGERDMLILARDRRGKRPLFYRYDGKKIYFSSEVKAILAVSDSRVSVSREIISRHIAAPVGIYGAADIYCEIMQVLPGECVIFTSMGMSRFFYRDVRDSRKIRSKGYSKKDRAVLPYPNLDLSRLDEYLNDALIAFDHPQFDCYMPSLCALLSSAISKTSDVIFFEDFVKRKNIHYSYEREDRLGNLYGKRAIGILPKVDDYGIDERLSGMREELYSRFFSLDTCSLGILKSLFGSSRLDFFRRTLERGMTKKEDAEENIRILGMLLQSVEWAQANRLAIKDQSGSVCCDYI